MENTNVRINDNNFKVVDCSILNQYIYRYYKKIQNYLEQKFNTNYLKEGINLNQFLSKNLNFPVINYDTTFIKAEKQLSDLKFKSITEGIFFTKIGKVSTQFIESQKFKISYF